MPQRPIMPAAGLTVLLALAAGAGLASDSQEVPGPASETALTAEPTPPGDDPPLTPTTIAPEPPRASNDLTDQQRQLLSCSIPKEDEFLGFEWARRTSYRSVCLASHWADSLFGPDTFDPMEGQVNGYVALTVENRQGGGWDTTPRVRARVKLPQASKKLDLFFDRDKESQTIAGASTALQSEAGTATESSTNQLGIGYRLREGVSDLLNFRIGLRIRSWHPDWFVRSRYAVLLAESEKARWDLEQILFWKESEGFGEATGLEYQRHLGGANLFRWSNSATFSETSQGVRWSTALSILHALSDDRALQGTYGANGETRASESVTNHGPRISYRLQLKQRWLIMELYTGIDHLKDETSLFRRRESYVGIRMEGHFNPP